MSGIVAVTGATGFVGRHLIDRLVSAGWQVRALVRRPDADLPSDGVTPVPGSMEDAESLRRLVEGADHVVHSAGLIKAASREEFDRVNGYGTGLLAEACAAQAVPPRLIYLSSLAARTPELSDYGASKRLGETELAERAGALHWTILRPPVIYGPGDRETLKLFKLMRHGVVPAPNLDGARMSLIYVGDLCAAVLSLLAAPVAGGGTFEISDGCAEGYSWRRLAAAGAEQFGRRVVCFPVPRAFMRLLAGINVGLAYLTGGAPMITPGKVREIFHSDWVCHDNPLTRLVDWRPAVMIDEGFGRTVNWYRCSGWI